MMAPSCLRNTDIEEINSMLLEELLGISNKRLKYIFNGQSLDEDSSSSTSEDKPVDVISLDDISDDDLVINIDDDEGVLQHKKRRKESKHHKCKKEKIKKLVKQEEENNDKKTPEGEEEIDSNKNLMSVLELLELQARARAIKSQLLLENAKTQESISLSKIPTLEEKVGSDDEVIIKTAKAEEIVITSSESENEDSAKDENKKKSEENENIPENVVKNNEEEENRTGTVNTQQKKIIEDKELSSGKIMVAENSNNKLLNKETSVQIIDDNSKEIKDKNKEKLADNDGIIQINLSDDEMDELK